MTEKVGGGTTVRGPSGKWSGQINIDKKGDLHVHPDSGVETEVAFHPPAAKLIDVITYGTKYEPPATFKGQAIPMLNPFAHPHPISVARLMVDHLEELIGEAKQLV